MKFAYIHWPPAKEVVEKTGINCWQLVHGREREPFDESAREFWCQNPAVIQGWLKLGRRFLEEQKRAQDETKAAFLS